MTDERQVRSGYDDPVFPNGADPSCFGFTYGRGLSKREHYAALVLAGMYANTDIAGTSVNSVHHEAEVLTTRAVMIADLLVEKLSEADRGDA